MLRELTCAHCGGAGLELQPDGQIACRYCGTPMQLEDQTICANCEYLNPISNEFCVNCRRPLFRVCSACQHKNWNGADHCVQCGRTLDLLEYLTDRVQQDTASRLNHQQYNAAILKTQEEEASQRRMAQMMEMENRRQQALAEAATRRAARERQLITFTCLGAALFGLIIVGVTLAFVLAR